MEPIDRKFNFSAICTEHGETYTHHEAMVFLAKDKALVPTLEFYREECEKLGAMPAQMLGIDLLIERVRRYQAENQEKIKVADIDLPEGERILAPNEP